MVLHQVQGNGQMKRELAWGIKIRGYIYTKSTANRKGVEWRGLCMFWCWLPDLSWTRVYWIIHTINQVWVPRSTYTSNKYTSTNHLLNIRYPRGGGTQTTVLWIINNISTLIKEQLMRQRAPLPIINGYSMDDIVHFQRLAVIFLGNTKIDSYSLCFGKTPLNMNWKVTDFCRLCHEIEFLVSNTEGICFLTQSGGISSPPINEQVLFHN